MWCFNSAGFVEGEAEAGTVSEPILAPSAGWGEISHFPSLFLNPRSKWSGPNLGHAGTIYKEETLSNLTNLVASFWIFPNTDTMVNGRKWLNYGVATAFVLASISCAILALQALCKETNAKAGIATV